ncbi:MAG: hypothetical protein OXU20_38090 [Myxococcales bacterium]|nr:hypothetical protein [Myxococcales bacterium]MDD9970087.1 hypothetical protein [Myxococcales bacterium]
MPNEAGRAYGLTALCPIKHGAEAPQPGKPARSFAARTRDLLQDLNEAAESPMACVPNTYLCRFLVLDNVAYQGDPAKLDRLRSSYLVFVADLHAGKKSEEGLRRYLEGMWEHAEPTVRSLWEHCVGFDTVSSSDAFVRYVKRCQVENTLYFNGSTDEPLAEQLKNLYLKQEFSRFAFEHQGKKGAELQAAFGQFLTRTRPHDLSGPTWKPGARTLDDAVIDPNPPPQYLRSVPTGASR